MAIIPTIIGMDGSSGSAEMSGKDIVQKLKTLNGSDKLPASAITGVVTSVNSNTGAITVTAESINAQPKNDTLTKLSSTEVKPNGMLWVNNDGSFATFQPTAYASSLMQLGSAEAYRSMLNLGSFSMLDLDDKGMIPVDMLSEKFSDIAFSGSYKDLKDLPTPSTPGTGQEIEYPVVSVNGQEGEVNLVYTDVGAASEDHTHDIKAIDGLDTILQNKLSVDDSIPYSQIVEAPEIPDPQVHADWNATSGISQILNKPTLFDGDYNSLTNKPEIPVVNYPVTSVNGQEGNVSLTAEDVNAAPVEHTHRLEEINGLVDVLQSKMGKTDSIEYSRLTGVPSIPAAQVNADWNSTSGVSQILNKPTLFDGRYESLTGKPVIFDGDYNSLTNKPTIPVVNYPVTSVNSKTGSVVLNNTDVGAAASQHTHTIAEVNGLQTALNGKMNSGSTIPYSSLTGVPTMPVNNSFSFKGLNDTDDAVIANGFLRWNSTGTSISYATTIPYSAITGTPTLSTVAGTGSYNDLLNKPSIPSNTSQITEGTNLYYTDARVNALLNSSGVRRVETLQGTTNSSGVYQVTFANTYTVPPHVNPVIINGTANQFIVLSNVTTTGCTITVSQRAAVTLLAIEVLLAATTPVNGATVGVLVVPR